MLTRLGNAYVLRMPVICNMIVCTMYPVCTYLYLLSSHLWLDDIYELLNLSTDLPQIMIGELSRTSAMFLDRV